jgi:hypothetical protein
MFSVPSALRTAIVHTSPTLSKLTRAIEEESKRSERFFLTPEGELLWRGRVVPRSMLDLYDVVHTDGDEATPFPFRPTEPIGFKPEKTTRESRDTTKLLLDNRSVALRGIPLPKRAVVQKTSSFANLLEKIRETVRYPFIARPLQGGHSGSRRVASDEDLKRLFEQDGEFLIEENVSGATAWVLVLPHFREQHFYTAIPIGRIKEDVYGPIHLKEPLKSNLLETAITTAEELGIEKFSLLAFRVADDGRILFLKGNPVPDILEKEVLDASLQSVGLSYTDLARHLLSRVSV